MKKSLLLVLLIIITFNACSLKNEAMDNQQKSITKEKQSSLITKRNPQHLAPALQGSTPIGVKIIKTDNAKETSDKVYINSSYGWEAKYSDAAMFSQEAILYKTINGGKNWSKINSSKNSVPLTTKTGMTFLNTKTGWITTELPKNGYIGLYKTLDGGLSWKFQKINIPSSYKKREFDVFPPVFFSKNDAVLLTRPYNLAPLVFITDDSGKTWSPLTERTAINDIKWCFNKSNNVSTWLVNYHSVVWKSTNGFTWSICKN